MDAAAARPQVCQHLRISFSKVYMYVHPSEKKLMGHMCTFWQYQQDALAVELAAEKEIAEHLRNEVYFLSPEWNFYTICAQCIFSAVQADGCLSISRKLVGAWVVHRLNPTKEASQNVE